MPRCKLTEHTVAKLRAPTASGRPQLVWDAQLKGFGVLSATPAAGPMWCSATCPAAKPGASPLPAVNEMALAQAKDAARESAGRHAQGHRSQAPQRRHRHLARDARRVPGKRT